MAKFNLPTTSMSPETIIVWKEGKSAETSHENFPEVVGVTCERTNWLSFDDDCWKRQGSLDFKEHLRGVNLTEVIN